MENYTASITATLMVRVPAESHLEARSILMGLPDTNIASPEVEIAVWEEFHGIVAGPLNETEEGAFAKTFASEEDKNSDSMPLELQETVTDRILGAILSAAQSLEFVDLAGYAQALHSNMPGEENAEIASIVASAIQIRDWAWKAAALGTALHFPDPLGAERGSING